MHHSKSAFLTTLAKILSKGDKNYCYASQSSYLSILNSIHHVRITDRCLRKHMLELAKEGYIKKVRRWGRLKDGTIFNKSSAVCLTPKGCMYLCKQGLSWAWAHLKNLTNYVKTPPSPTNTPEASHPDKRSHAFTDVSDYMKAMKKHINERQRLRPLAT